jgi:hypothetical protein
MASTPPQCGYPCTADLQFSDVLPMRVERDPSLIPPSFGGSTSVACASMGVAPAGRKPPPANITRAQGSPQAGRLTHSLALDSNAASKTQHWRAAIGKCREDAQPGKAICEDMVRQDQHRGSVIGELSD